MFFCLAFVMHLCASVYLCLVVTCWERTDIFGLMLGRRLRAKFWPDCAIPDTSMKFGTVVDHD